jgi:hypothetical protein
VPPIAAGAAGWHGALMISAFLGTVISLERAVALGRGWAYAAPAAAGIGGVALLAGAPLVVTQVLGVIAAALLVAASIQVLPTGGALHLILAAGALCWLIGNLAWLAGAPLTAGRALVAGLPGADHRRRTPRTDPLPADAAVAQRAVLRHRRGCRIGAR